MVFIYGTVGWLQAGKGDLKTHIDRVANKYARKRNAFLVNLADKARLKEAELLALIKTIKIGSKDLIIVMSVLVSALSSNLHACNWFEGEKERRQEEEIRVSFSGYVLRYIQHHHDFTAYFFPLRKSITMVKSRYA